jgi:hypothetical protein
VDAQPGQEDAEALVDRAAGKPVRWVPARVVEGRVSIDRGAVVVVELDPAVGLNSKGCGLASW